VRAARALLALQPARSAATQPRRAEAQLLPSRRVRKPRPAAVAALAALKRSAARRARPQQAEEASLV
jgi:hypothetical protein